MDALVWIGRSITQQRRYIKRFLYQKADYCVEGMGNLLDKQIYLANPEVNLPMNLSSGEGGFPLNDVLCQWAGVCLNPHVD